jgi:hypothetical protein
LLAFVYVRVEGFQQVLKLRLKPAIAAGVDFGKI